MTPEWLDARDVSLTENTFITSTAETLAKLYSKDFDKKNLKEFLNIIFRDKDLKEYIYEETLNLLKEHYHLDINNINI